MEIGRLTEPISAFRGASATTEMGNGARNLGASHRIPRRSSLAAAAYFSGAVDAIELDRQFDTDSSLHRLTGR